ncbi:MAG: DUF1501 domain-containing protein, partial [Bdellovibrionaceae bacterium]|nr:DUF1501 domain-containing protein [Pseudobdellovibrionaceae bacterium]
FVYIFIPDGLDCTLGLDPQVLPVGADEKDMFIEYQSDAIRKFGEIPLAPAAFHLGGFYREMAVVNGLFVSSTNNDHPSAQSYLKRGDLSGDLGVMSMTVERLFAEMNPFGVIASHPTLNANDLQLKSPITIGDSVFSGVLATRATVLENSIKESDLAYLNSLYKFLSSEVRLNSFNHWLKIMKSSQAKQLDSAMPDEIPEKRAIIVAASAFLAGVAQSAFVEIISGGIDSHSNHPGNHWQLQEKMWKTVATIFSFFKSIPFGSDGQSLFDRTLFLVATEFSRTPFLNSAQGKDHNPFTNSILLAGYGIRGNQVVGRSRLITRRQTANGEARHVATLINFETGQVAKNRTEAQGDHYQLILPENILVTVLKALRLPDESVINKWGHPALRRPISKILKPT